MDSLMKPAKHREFASAILIDTLGRLLFQECDNFQACSNPAQLACSEATARTTRRICSALLERSMRKSVIFFHMKALNTRPVMTAKISIVKVALFTVNFSSRVVSRPWGGNSCARPHASISVASTEKMPVRQQRLNLRMVEKFAHELGKRRADLQPIVMKVVGSHIGSSGESPTNQRYKTL